MSGNAGQSSAVLLDTCAVLFVANAEPMALPALTRILHAARTGGVLVSPISAWEIGLLARPKRGRSLTDFQPDPRTWFESVLHRRGFRQAPFTPTIAIAASFLPGDFHGDPADRMLVATARDLGVSLVTRDARIRAYGRAGHVEVVAC